MISQKNWRRRRPNWMGCAFGVVLILSAVLAIVLFVLTADRKLSEWLR